MRMPVLAPAAANKETAMPTLMLRVVGVVAMMLVTAVSVTADPVRVASGLLSMDTGGPAYFVLRTSDGRSFEAEPIHVDWPAECFYRCSTGDVIPLSSTVTNYDGPVVFRADGMPAYPDIAFAFLAPSVTLGSDAGSVEGPHLVFRRPFTFTGQLAGYADAELAGAPLFDMTLAGTGVARLTMGIEDGRYSFSSLEYAFQSIDPVPEPGTLLLVGAGAALLLRNRRAKAQAPGRVAAPPTAIT
jgi:hypothetical protein